MLIAVVLTFGMQSNNYIESYLYHVYLRNKSQVKKFTGI